LTDLTGFYPGHEGFYIQAFSESVTFLAAGHHYDSLWTLLSVGLSPTGTSASFAAPDPTVQIYRSGFLKRDSPHCTNERIDVTGVVRSSIWWKYFSERLLAESNSSSSPFRVFSARRVVPVRARIEPVADRGGGDWAAGGRSSEGFAV